MKSITIQDINNVPGLKKELEYLFTHRVEVGIFGSQNSDLLIIASVHEFGAQIKVTPKMRGYLASQGLHLNPKTLFIKIPERSYLRSMFDENQTKIEKYANQMFIKLLSGEKGWTGERILGRLGAYMVSLAQKQIREKKDPPLHWFTIKRKKKHSDKPLVDTGRLKASITWQIVPI